QMILHHPRSTLLPYTTLFRSLLAERLHPLDHQVGLGQQAEVLRQHLLDVVDRARGLVDIGLAASIGVGEAELRIGGDVFEERLQDRKSRRLNSSHVKISYAVF